MLNGNNLHTHSTAAGDTYIGALAAELARGAELVCAARTASRAAALTVTRVGAQQATPTLAEVVAQEPSTAHDGRVD